MTLLEEIKAAIERAGDERFSENFGLRVCDDNPAIGDDYDHVSNHWVDGTPTDDPTDGACTIGVTSDTICKSLDLVRHYLGGRLLLLTGQPAGYGDDIGELILRDPIVLGSWDVD